jgi:hypothetical protein
MPNQQPQHYRKVTPAPYSGSTLVVETGSGTDPNANAYITVAGADDWLAGQLYADEWNAASPTDKNRALISATRSIDASCMFRGYRKLTLQPLDWPRVLAINDETAPYGGGSAYSPLSLHSGQQYYDSNKIPVDLAHATALQAQELLKANRTADPTKGITQMGLGSGALSITFTGAEADQVKPLSDEVTRMLEPMCDGFHGSNSGSRKVVRVP